MIVLLKVGIDNYQQKASLQPFVYALSSNTYKDSLKQSAMTPHSHVLHRYM